jgi:hypothetical protein
MLALEMLRGRCSKSLAILGCSLQCAGWLTGLTALAGLAGCGGGSSGSGSSSVATATAPQIATQPANQTAAVGQTATFAVVATGSAPLSYQWSKNGTAISGATSASYITPPAAAADNGSQFSVRVANSAGSTTSASATLTVTAAASGTDVTMYKNDVGRTGQNLTESILTPANVASTTFGLRLLLPLDGNVDAQPLYLSHLTLAGATHNVLYVATEADSVYALDAQSGATLWKVSLLGAGESTAGTVDGCDQVSPEIGVTSTPVIDPASGPNGAIYVVAMSEDDSMNYHQRLHALDVTTGAELFGGPQEIAATFAGTSFVPEDYEERAALLLLNGTIYTSWTSHCDVAPYGGWIIAYSESTLLQTAALNVAPGATDSDGGPAIWMSGGGPGADSSGNIYLLTANGNFETTLNSNGFPSGGDYGNSFLKLATTGGALTVADYFTMSNEVDESASDTDLGSGGELLLPDLTDSGGTVRHLVVGAGKDGNLYVVNRDSMGKFSSSGDNIWQELDGVLSGGIWSTPAYFNGTLYYGPVGQPLMAFAIANAMVSGTPSSSTATSFTYPGTAPAISANGTANAIVWTHENTNPAVLHAYDATNLANELYNSNQAANGRDQFGAGNKFITPTIADGQVFVGTTGAVAIFGLLN